MNIYKVLPDLRRERHMKMWHKALRAQWSAEDLDWSRPLRIQESRLRDQMGRLLTPILMGEQAALYSVSGLIPVLGHRSEVESQLYLTTWAVDEGRHTELFARFYHRLDREPLSIRRFPAGYLFQSQIVAKDPGEWLAGVLVSEVLAKLVMEDFVRLDLDPVLSEIAEGILKDEARHLGFNHIYLEERLAADFQRLGEVEGSEEPAPQPFAQVLEARLESVLSYVDPMLSALDDELTAVGMSRLQLLETLDVEAKRRLRKSIEAGQRLAQRRAAGEAEDGDESDLRARLRDANQTELAGKGA